MDAELAGAGDVGDGAVAVSAVEAGVAAVEVCGSERGFDFDGSGEGVDGVGVGAHAEEDCAAVEVGNGHLGVEVECAVEVGHDLVEGEGGFGAEACFGLRVSDFEGTSGL